MFIHSSNDLLTKILNFFSLIYLFNIFIASIFMRPFVGVYLFGYRIGEIYTGIGLVICFLLFSNKIIRYYKIESFKLIINSIKYILISFFVVLILNFPKLIKLDLIRNSSFIWTVGFLILGLIFLKRIKLEIVTLTLITALLSVYFITFINYPNFVMDFFIKYSDKFQFIKAADALLVLIITNLIIKKNNIRKYSKLLFFIISSSLFLPYFFSQSRGSVLAFFVFTALYLFSFRNFLIKNYLKSLILVFLYFLFFYLSSILISGINFSSEENVIDISEINSSIQNEVIKKKNISKGFLTFYLYNGRIYSYDNTTNWRLDIWQDLIEDLKNKQKLFFGFGYEKVFEIMLDPTAPGRLGRDGLNENVHNYFINILGRGGFFQLLLFLFLYLNIYKFWILNDNVNNLLILFLPAFILSSLDVTMEGVQFPLLFYSFIGYFLATSYDE